MTSFDEAESDLQKVWAEVDRNLFNSPENLWDRLNSRLYLLYGAKFDGTNPWVVLFRPGNGLIKIRQEDAAAAIRSIPKTPSMFRKREFEPEVVRPTNVPPPYFNESDIDPETYEPDTFDVKTFKANLADRIMNMEEECDSSSPKKCREE